METMIDGENNVKDEPAHDSDMERELEGVPQQFRDDGDDDEDEGGTGGDLNEALASLRADLDAAKQDVLYARADTQNVRRRMEKDVADARAYAATGFARATF